MQSDTIDADECAQLLRCTAGQVEEMARGGEIPGLKIGRGWLFVRADLLAFLAQRAREEAAERRARRAPASVAKVAPIRPSRRAPPALPVVPTAARPDPRP